MATPSLHYPRSEREFRSWFSDDLACLDYLDWLRWGEARFCHRCGCVAQTRAIGGRFWRCNGCKTRISRTAGTIFQDTRTPLTVQFAAAWELCVDKGGISALALQRRLGLASYQTTWTMLHRYRAAMARSGQELLTGTVEVDETFLGGTRPGPRGRGALGKTMIGVAVETPPTGGFGRVRLRILADASEASLRALLLDTVERRSTVVTDGLKEYIAATAGLYTHQRHIISGSGSKAHELLPGVHRVASLFKRWTLGTLQGSIGEDHLEAYLAEFTFRFNRRHSRDRGLLFHRLVTLAATTPPLTYRALVQDNTPKPTPPIPPRGGALRPQTLEPLPLARPWRDVVSAP